MLVSMRRAQSDQHNTAPRAFPPVETPSSQEPKPLSRRARRESAHALATGGIKSIIVFLVALLVFGCGGYAAYSMIVNRSAPSLPIPGSAPGGSITIGLTSAPDSLDIRKQTGDAVSQALLGNVYETVTKRGEDNTAQPGIAKSWDVSDDGLSYTFHIADGITFSNGDQLNADDVVYSLQQTLQKQYVGYEDLTGLASVKATGSSTVVIKLSSPMPDLPWVLSGRAGIVYDETAKVNYMTGAIGSGPFLVESWKKGDPITLKANTTYWGTKAKIGTVTLRYYTDAGKAADDLKSGDIQAIMPTDVANANALKTQDNITVAQTDSTRKVVLGFNSSADSLFSDARVRQSARMAIDKNAIVQANGAAERLGGPIPKLDPGYEDLTGLYPLDQAKAKSLVSYFRLRTMKLVYPSSLGEQIGQTVKDNLAAAGIPVEVSMVDDATWQQTVVQDKQFDLTIYAMNDSHDAGDFVARDNFLQYTNAEVENLYAQTRAATTDDDYANRLKEYAHKLSEDSPADWLYVERPWVAYKSTVKGLPTAMVDCYLPLAGVTIE
ncbi:ABC transporter substrate-binding protein [Bifidobacterium tissieri]|uniref:ABC transporter substrate-binding protein n=1 Tax=Bifidobacterium tissieri TaxID=1630162 RepID=A0A5M9ZP22_9BIFI|nr:ABC transporter substrate-binding protein [Bifidobacterium tissieri]KAA8831367.1 ABC transporter substrate-binding protein [Bifidobacterium tissieri]